jgi:AcrR family transcriptional regulator
MSTTEQGPPTTPSLRRPRADAQRNAARLLDAAREVFADQGSDASLEAIAARAGVGIGTLYRHFPNRDALVEAVFRDTIDASCQRAEDLLEELEPGEALAAWLREQMHGSRACRGLGAEAMIMMLDENGNPACDAMRQSGAKLLARAQQAGRARADTNVDDLVRLVNAIGVATEDAPDREAQADRLFALMMDGMRP